LQALFEETLVAGLIGSESLIRKMVGSGFSGFLYRALDAEQESDKAARLGLVGLFPNTSQLAQQMGIAERMGAIVAAMRDACCSKRANRASGP
jgi:hypothetical protein